ncbi:metal-sulfur cluster assembly factor [Streptococcus hillyeri]|uniref:DUF59 domain-containing protein n=1 Tax=Streptococcus hillyeri TaxID=2282420 RepID=A0A3L9DMY9_9STRE|nr:metal-sulfur cluster assembly factor [Streptococcus hillyeri]RLY01487.1 DUF59 domain-containing protein [Streptococcus hillyeri]
MRDDIKINDRALALSEPLIDIFESIFDPEIGLDIYNLGLIYDIHLDDTGHMDLLMTFTDINCNCSDSMPDEIINKLTSLDEINSVNVEITYKPVWKMTRISRYGRIALGISPRGGK